MEEFYRLNHPVMSCSNIDVVVHDQLGNITSTSATTSTFHGPDVGDDNMLRFETEALGTEMSDLIKAQIANHPRYPDVVAAYIECQKVGAPPETAFLLEEISRENHPLSCCSEIGADPELDEFMESYCEILHGYKEELSKPFNEATTFLSNIESQLSNLCKGTLTKTVDYHSDDDHEGECGTSEEELMMSNSNSGDHEEEQKVVESELILDETYCVGGGRGLEEQVVELKEMLLRKYSGYLTTLRKDFLKKRKKGKLPKDARSALLDWWNTHLAWPYPTEEEKVKLLEMTGLDQKQINNWFINQRKRHWKPSEEMRFALMDGTGQ